MSLVPGTIIQAWYPGSIAWTDYEVLLVHGDRIRVRNGSVEIELLTADLTRNGQVKYRINGAELNEATLPACAPVPSGGWACTTPGCPERSMYADGPFKCWACRNGA